MVARKLKNKTDKQKPNPRLSILKSWLSGNFSATFLPNYRQFIINKHASGGCKLYCSVPKGFNHKPGYDYA